MHCPNLGKKGTDVTRVFNQVIRKLSNPNQLIKVLKKTSNSNMNRFSPLLVDLFDPFDNPIEKHKGAKGNTNFEKPRT